MAIDINAILADQASQQATANELMQKTISAQEQANAETLTAKKEASELETDLANSKATRTAAAEASTALTKTSLEGGDNPATNLIMDLANASNKATREMLSVQDTILQKQKVEFLDDPLAWFAARYSIDEDIAQYNTLSTMASSASGKIREIEASVSDVAKTNLATVRTLEGDNLAKQTRLNVLKGIMDVKMLDHELLKQNVDGMKAMAQGKSQLVETQMKQFAVSMQMQANARENAAAGRAAQLFPGQLRLQELQTAAAEDKLNEDSTLLKTVNVGLGLMHQQPVTKADLAAMMKSKLHAPRMEKALEIGLSNADLIAGMQEQENATAKSENRAPTKITSAPPVIGTTAGDVVYNAHVLQTNFKAVPMQARTYAWLEGLANTAATGINVTDPKERDLAIKKTTNKYAEESIAAMKKNAETTGSIYAAPTDPRALLAANPQAGNSKFFQTYVAPQIKAGATNLGSDQLLATFDAAVASKEISAEEASVGLAKYFKEVGSYNTVHGNFQGMAVAPQTNYRKAVETRFGTKMFNLADPTELIMRSKIKEFERKFQESSGAPLHLIPLVR